MRIIGGKHRGRRLTAPPGRDLRPTADRIREALFNILAHGSGGDPFHLLGARVLDAFAGTGAIGLEALSRGADHASFIDTDPTACRKNIEQLGETANTTVLRRDCLSPPNAAQPCGLVFMDPPYRSGLAGPALTALDGAGWIDEDAVCVIELAAKESLDLPPNYGIFDERRYGTTGILLARRRNAS